MVFATSPRYYFYFKEKPGKKKGLLGLAELYLQTAKYGYISGPSQGLKIRVRVGYLVIGGFNVPLPWLT